MAQERSTRQRTALRAVIEAAQRPLSPQEICEAASHTAPGLGIATVYRNLKLMVESGEIQPVIIAGQAARYEGIHHAHRHHHHFQCDVCKRVFDVHNCPGNFEKMAPKGFRVDRHEITLYGVCADCR